MKIGLYLLFVVGTVLSSTLALLGFYYLIIGELSGLQPLALPIWIISTVMAGYYSFLIYREEFGIRKEAERRHKP